jgi:formylglycine-generating enzyme required for sulfatase activity
MTRLQKFQKLAISVAVIILYAFATPAFARAQASLKPMSKEAIIRLLKGDVPPKRVEALARQHGIDFQVTADTETELRQAGATEALMKVLRELATSAPGKTVSAAATRENPKDGLKYVWIPPGTFMMGCSPGDTECKDEEKPLHRVRLTKGFSIGQTPVAVGAYKRFARSAGKTMPPEPNNLGRPLNSGWSNDAMPIVSVTWDEAQDYCTWAGGRLPSEAEWEYAARGGSTEARYGPLDEVAWFADNSGQQRLDSAEMLKDDEKNFGQRLKDNGNGMHEVALKRPNGFGLFDTLGNVDEWVNDWYDENYYQNSPSQDPPGPSSGALRVLRGGPWYDRPGYVRVSFRFAGRPGEPSYGAGFRCAGEVGIP